MDTIKRVVTNGPVSPLAELVVQRLRDIQQETGTLSTESVAFLVAVLLACSLDELIALVAASSDAMETVFADVEEAIIRGQS